jgi:hypothetical protein
MTPALKLAMATSKKNQSKSFNILQMYTTPYLYVYGNGCGFVCARTHFICIDCIDLPAEGIIRGINWGGLAFFMHVAVSDIFGDGPKSSHFRGSKSQKGVFSKGMAGNTVKNYEKLLFLEG